MALVKLWQKVTLQERDRVHLSGEPIVEVSRVSMRYDGVVALEDVSFAVKAGERIAIVGPNGAGKSTLLRIIAGVLTPTTGSVRIYGRGPGGHLCIAYIPQRNQVDWNFPLTVADVVMMGRIGKMGLLRHPGPRDWAMVRRALEQVGMADLADRPIRALSGGQQQRMFIARALAQEAELLLMDEPFTGLDRPAQEGILEILEHLRRQGVTILLATHDLEQAASHFDRVLLLNRRLIAFGPPDAVFTPEALRAAYGGHLRLVPVEGELVAVGDTCCEGG
ncbi:High-affinity zinc uptake system ATP-binding protein ZnuC [Candidatus Thermoflexus japonica]|uniref:High-affinity zinc uptake system ATP-binding protein ZnuC n=1 Tax=Candidatus Thermoflexus japonica TaxID=2035417 RepID=A0A2H5Y6H2_9CHLR|nr:High-affinity zinc uptake system ATP-binding protein ZnuC [Candidatus Thermoflexus japonica]